MYTMNRCAPGNRNFEQTGTCYSAKDLRALAKRKGDKRLRENRFRPDKPREWVDQEFTWLNSMDISAVMKQYEKADPTFQFLGVLPRDFAVLKNPSGKCVIANTCNFDAGSVFRKSKSKVRRIGMVINLDKWGQGGSHWVALLIDMKRRAIMYYDSTTDPPHRDILVFMQQQRRAISNALRIDMDMQYNTVERQFKNTECGIFAMTFLAMMLETKLTFQEVCHIMPRDADIHMLRSVFYV